MTWTSDASSSTVRVISTSWIITLSIQQSGRERGIDQNKQTFSIPALWNVTWNFFFFSLIFCWSTSQQGVFIDLNDAFWQLWQRKLCVSVWLCAAETTINHAPRMCVTYAYMIHSGHFVIRELKKAAPANTTHSLQAHEIKPGCLPTEF